MEGKRPAKLNFLFSSSLHGRVHECIRRMLRASVVWACPKRTLILHTKIRKSWIAVRLVPYFIECGEERFGEDRERIWSVSDFRRLYGR